MGSPDSGDTINTVVTVRLSISRKAWEATYGSSASPRELKADIKEHAASTVVSHLRAVGVWADD